jgi:hydrogenase-4 component B
MPAVVPILTLACLLPILFASVALVLKTNHRLWSACLALFAFVLAVCALSGWQTPVDWCLPQPFYLGATPCAVRIDKLAAIFLLLLSTVTGCAAVYSPAYLKHIDAKVNGRFYWAALFSFVAGMAAVICASNAVAFIVAWEVMSLSSAALVASEFQQQKAQRATVIYLVATRIATGLLSVAFLIMYARTGSWAFDAWNFHSAHTWLAAGLIAAGLSIKAGIWPFHIWLPYAHPEAPAPVSALMSGVMVKIALYAAIRLLVFGQLGCQPLAYVLFGFACISAFWGVLFAINQHDMKRLLAYHTVENVSLIMIGISLCIWSKNLGLLPVAQIALAGALLHCWAHGLFKSLLFLCAGSVGTAAHSVEFSQLGGLSKLMPWTWLTFMIGCAAICALPPLNGFGSKWYFYQALLGGATQMTSLADRGVCLVAIAVLAACGALAIGCFVKTAGVSFLGTARSTETGQAQEVSGGMIACQLILTAACVLMGLMTPQIVAGFAPVLAAGTGASASLLGGCSIQFLQIAGGLAVLLGLIYALVLSRAPKRYRTWDCGFGDSGARAQVTAESFAQPIARLFSPVLQYNVRVEIQGRDRRHFPENISVHTSTVSLLETKLYAPAAYGMGYLSRLLERVQELLEMKLFVPAPQLIWHLSRLLTRVQELLEMKLFAPSTHVVGHLSSLLARLQSGSIHLYLLYLCVALVVLIVAGMRLW